MKTGYDVSVLGLYVSDCCNQELILGKAESFPRCLKCSSLTEWQLWEELTESSAGEPGLRTA